MKILVINSGSSSLKFQVIDSQSVSELTGSSHIRPTEGLP